MFAWEYIAFFVALLQQRPSKGEVTYKEQEFLKICCLHIRSQGRCVHVLAFSPIRSMSPRHTQTTHFLEYTLCHLRSITKEFGDCKKEGEEGENMTRRTPVIARLLYQVLHLPYSLLQ